MTGHNLHNMSMPSGALALGVLVAASSSAATSALSGSGAVTDSQVAQPSAVGCIRRDHSHSHRRWCMEAMEAMVTIRIRSSDAVRSYDRLNFKCPDARIANRASI
jgi:hypothetical protein